jgi:hypothetical protein
MPVRQIEEVGPLARSLPSFREGLTRRVLCGAACAPALMAKHFDDVVGAAHPLAPASHCCEGSKCGGREPDATPRIDGAR